VESSPGRIRAGERAALALTGLLLGSATLGSPPARAQERPVSDRDSVVAARPSHLVPGDSVRVRAPEFGRARREARLLGVRGDTLMLAGAPGTSPDVIALPLASVRTLEVARGTTSDAWYGVKMGALAGAVSGLAVSFIGLLASDPDKCEGVSGWCSHVEFDPGRAALLTLGFTAAGALGGAVLMGPKTSAAWVPVDAATLRVEPRADGAAVVASIPLRF
jgi:hypothetical protein